MNVEEMHQQAMMARIEHAENEAKRKNQEAIRRDMMTLSSTLMSLPWIALIREIKGARNDR